MSKGIPVIGRDPNGKAKIVNVDEHGNLKVAQSGNIVLLVNHLITIDPGTTVELGDFDISNIRSMRLALAASSANYLNVRVRVITAPSENGLGYVSDRILNQLVEFTSAERQKEIPMVCGRFARLSVINQHPDEVMWGNSIYVEGLK